MRLKLLVTAGDGIGPEVTNEAVKVLEEVMALGGHTLTLYSKRIGGIAITTDGTPLPADTLAAALASDAVLLGAVGGNEFNSLAPDKRPEAGLLAIRSALGGFANLRPAFAFKELAVNPALRPEIIDGADILFVRELLGGLYFGQPRQWDKAKGEAWNTMRYTRDEVVRVARIAFSLAQKRRKKLCSVDKANVLEVSQLWRAAVIEVSAEFPDVQLEHQYVDAMAMHLMNRPRDFDVVLTENLFGDILSDESGVITGSLGMLFLGHHRRQGQSLRAHPRLRARHRAAARASPIHSAQFLPAHSSCATPAASKPKPHPSSPPFAKSSSKASAPPTSPAATPPASPSSPQPKWAPKSAKP